MSIKPIVEQSLQAAISHFATFEAFGNNDILLVTGIGHDNKPLTVVVSKVELELSVALVKRLYNAKWTQRHIGLVFGIAQPKVSTMIRDRTVQVSRVFKQ